MISCSTYSPGKKNREEVLRRDVRSFHWAVISRDAPVALRHVPAEDRDPWDDSFACLFQRLRLVDYKVEHVKYGEDSSEATVRVRWTGHALDSLVVEEMLWKEQWSFNRKKQRWSLVSDPDAIRGLPEDCLPKGIETKALEEWEAAD
jgi:hypothetical protein